MTAIVRALRVSHQAYLADVNKAVLTFLRNDISRSFIMTNVDTVPFDITTIVFFKGLLRINSYVLLFFFYSSACDFSEQLQAKKNTKRNAIPSLTDILPAFWIVWFSECSRFAKEAWYDRIEFFLYRLLFGPGEVFTFIFLDAEWSKRLICEETGIVTCWRGCYDRKACSLWAHSLETP